MKRSLIVVGAVLALLAVASMSLAAPRVSSGGFRGSAGRSGGGFRSGGGRSGGYRASGGFRSSAARGGGRVGASYRGGGRVGGSYRSGARVGAGYRGGARVSAGYRGGARVGAAYRGGARAGASYRAGVRGGRAYNTRYRGQHVGVHRATRAGWRAGVGVGGVDYIGVDGYDGPAYVDGYDSGYGDGGVYAGGSAAYPGGYAGGVAPPGGGYAGGGYEGGGYAGGVAAGADGGYGGEEIPIERRFLKVKNDTPGNLTVWLRYRTQTESGAWQWYPKKETETVSYVLDPGEETYLSHEDWKVNAGRVKIWARTSDGDMLDEFKNKELLLVDKDEEGSYVYYAPEMEDFTFIFAPDAE
jgi:hypothetical protein